MRCLVLFPRDFAQFGAFSRASVSLAALCVYGSLYGIVCFREFPRLVVECHEIVEAVIYRLYSGGGPGDGSVASFQKSCQRTVPWHHCFLSDEEMSTGKEPGLP